MAAKVKLSIRKQKNETGLCAIGQSPRGYEFTIIDETTIDNIGSVSAHNVGWQNWNGWYWVVSASEKYGIEWRNTADEKKVYDNIDAAKAECKAYILACLKAKGLK